EPHRRLSGGHVVNEIIRGQNVVVVKSVQMEANLQLSEIVQTGDSVCLLLGLAQGGQQQRGEQSDDANDHQQFNQGERQPVRIAAGRAGRVRFRPGQELLEVHSQLKSPKFPSKRFSAPANPARSSSSAPPPWNLATASVRPRLQL